LQFIGQWILSWVQSVGRAAWFLVGLCRFQGRPIIAWRPFLSSIGENSFYSLPLVSIAALFTGMVLAFQSAKAFKGFEHSPMMTEIVVLSIFQELGPVITGLLMAGRLGAWLAAELAAMRTSNQIEALVSLSTSPVGFLILPRIFAVVVVLPFLTMVATWSGVFGGGLTRVYHHGLSVSRYFQEVCHFVHYEDIKIGLIKAVWFGIVIGAVGAFQGYYSKRSAIGVGKATQKSVVMSSFIILLSNYFMTRLIKG